jgi:phosphopantothenoylcysteine decarboxylase/phosphopantothenate--cysteine ligase
MRRKADNCSMNGKRILLGVSGGIAAYKSAELVRRLVERGAQVQVVMTAAARQFVTPITFQALSGRSVRSDLWDAAAEAAMGHIELARSADVVLIAPGSADCLARLAHGLADDLLTTLCLATAAPVVIAPAMNQLMWLNPATQSNVELLARRGVRLLGPASGEQACGEHGPGRMLEPLEIVARLTPLLAPTGPLQGLRAVVTAGPTRECIDPVRFVSNRSSGKMGYAMAQALQEAGAEVVLISGPVSLPTPSAVRRIDVESCEQMHAAVQQELAGTAIFVGTAAVADYRPASCAEHKIKKTSDTMTLELVRTTDILSQVSASPQRPFVVGFAAETSAVEQHARSKLLAKNLDLIAANEVGHSKAFDSDENALLVLWRGGRVQLPSSSKAELARALTGLIAERYAEHLAAQQRQSPAPVGQPLSHHDAADSGRELASHEGVRAS